MPIVEIHLQEGHAAVGRRLRELDLPPESLIASIRRDTRVLIPRGETRLEAGDVLVALVKKAEENALRGRLARGP